MKRSPATELRYVKAELRKVKKERLDYHDEAHRLRHQNTTLRQELKEWKERFDILLRKESE